MLFFGCLGSGVSLSWCGQGVKRCVPVDWVARVEVVSLPGGVPVSPPHAHSMARMWIGCSDGDISRYIKMCDS